MLLNNSYENVTWIDNGDNGHSSAIIAVIVQVLVFCLGLNLHVKIIAVAKKEKDLTWQIYICHSIIVTICYSFTIMFANILNFAPFIPSYTGSWFCYFGNFVQLYCWYAMAFHTLLVAVMKFAFIVHREVMLEFGQEKGQRIFLCINVGMPLIWTVLGMLVAENGRSPFSSVNSCHIVATNTTPSSAVKFLFCEFGHEVKGGAYAYIVYVIKRCYCAHQEILHVVIFSNIPEALFYYKIFRTVRT